MTTYTRSDARSDCALAIVRERPFYALRALHARVSRRLAALRPYSRAWLQTRAALREVDDAIARIRAVGGGGR